MPLTLKCHAMARRDPVSTLSALGLAREEERLYQRLLPLSGSEVGAVAGGLRIAPDELPHELEGLLRPGSFGARPSRSSHPFETAPARLLSTPPQPLVGTTIEYALGSTCHVRFRSGP